MSRTGLLASPTKKVRRAIKKFNPNLKATTGPAPFSIKPLAGIYNPYPNRCSLLCNHPADGEARKMLQKAKNDWANDGKSYLYPEEVAAIRAELEQMHVKDTQRNHLNVEVPLDSVPEELFRRYTETDSRPLTPAPTLASAHTRASATRRCVTPDPTHTSKIREKTLLVLDLRRSHSQETLSWYGSTQTAEPPLIRITHVGEPRPSTPTTARTAPIEKKRAQQSSPSAMRRPRSAKPEIKLSQHLQPPHKEVASNDEEGDEDDGTGEEEPIKRRGRRRRKRHRDSSRVSVFRTTVDPETLVAGIGPDSLNPSARHSLDPTAIAELAKFASKENKRLSCLNIDSYLDYETLRQLRRELSAEIVEFEFNLERRLALQEAMKTVPKERVDCDELTCLRGELNLPLVNVELWLTLPRMFKRASSRFELPMDSRQFNDMSPLDYLKHNVYIINTRKLLYNCIFNIYKVQNELEEDAEEDLSARRILGKVFPDALNTMMGEKLPEAAVQEFKEMVGWEDEGVYDFKTFCGVCASCERLLAKEAFKGLPNRKLDPCHEVETVDFESLEQRLHKKNTDERLVKMLRLIKTR